MAGKKTNTKNVKKRCNVRQQDNHRGSFANILKTGLFLRPVEE